jgi:ATP/maltotriose-dependent transcriptional regulator MalT
MTSVESGEAARHGMRAGMTATTAKPKHTHRERRIIERPRLIKMLDECDARVILLLAPAGYGKTTLARQWAKTLNSVIWLSLTPAHRDVARFTEDLSTEVDRLGGEAAKFMGEYLRASSNPQRVAREVGINLARRLEAINVQWIVMDNYQELAGCPEIDELVNALQEVLQTRFLVASRLRPPWATTRRVMYSEVAELDRDDFVMTPEESRQILGGRRNLTQLVSQAKGWPAVIGLAARVPSDEVPKGSLPASLYQYLADELFQLASRELQGDLITLALLAELSGPLMEAHFGSRATQVLEEARDLGFVSNDDNPELHPLLKEFLLTKLLDEADAERRVREAVLANLNAASWEVALELVLRFELLDMVESTLERSFKPLVRSGRLGTLSTFAKHASSAPTFPPAVVDVVEAEVAQRDGQLQLAFELISRVRPRLMPDHPLRSRAEAIAGQSALMLANFEDAEIAFGHARTYSTDEHDDIEALYGLALSKVFGERPGASEAVDALFDRRYRSPTDLVRFATAELSRRRYGEGLKEPVRLEEPALALRQVQDPRARTALTYTAASVLAQRADYAEAKKWLALFFEDADAYGLEFTKPYGVWTSAQISIGLRKFAEAERSLQIVEDIAARTHDMHHQSNSNVLRARLLLQHGKPKEALVLMRTIPGGPLLPSWRGEFFGTRALVLALLGETQAAEDACVEAERISRSPEVHFFSTAVSAINAFRTNPSTAAELVVLADAIGIWDPLVTVLRAAPDLAFAASEDERARPLLEHLYRRTNDLALARRAGIRTRANRRPDELLTPREMDVLELLAQGYRNREIAKALYISESTTKVHIRHLFEKLGVRTRAEAIARHGIFKASS